MEGGGETSLEFLCLRWDDTTHPFFLKSINGVNLKELSENGYLHHNSTLNITSVKNLNGCYKL